jgi:hypothetical protein
MDRYRAVGLDFVPAEKFVAINKAGEHGCAWMGTAGIPRMSVRNQEGLSTYEGTAHHPPLR